MSNRYNRESGKIGPTQGSWGVGGEGGGGGGKEWRVKVRGMREEWNQPGDACI